MKENYADENNGIVFDSRNDYVIRIIYLRLIEMIMDAVKASDSIDEIKRALAIINKDIKLDFSAYVHMPMNDFTLASVASEESQRNLFDHFGKRIGKLASKISSNRKGYDFEPISFMLKSRNTPFVDRVNQLDRFYNVNGSCTGCGICEKVCQADNIGNGERKTSLEQ